MASQAVRIEGLSKITQPTYTLVAVPGCNDYRFNWTVEEGSPPELGYARAILLKEDIYIVQLKYDNYPNYFIMFLKVTEGPGGKNFKMMFPKSNIKPSDYSLGLKLDNMLGMTLIGSRRNIMKFLKAHADSDFTEHPTPAKPEASAKSNFCGTSTFGACRRNSDCCEGGCSAQVCQSKSEPPSFTICEYRECYNSTTYGLGCKCIQNKCQWAR